MAYKVRFEVKQYKPMRYSQKNWEPSTVNDFMAALAKWHTTEQNLREVRWRLEMFQGRTWLDEEYDQTTGGMSERYRKWLEKRCNTVKYEDKLCKLTRTHYPCGYGFTQGYFNRDQKIEELRKNGYTRVYFRELYDMRQYRKNYDGCYMEIYKTGTDVEQARTDYRH